MHKHHVSIVSTFTKSQWRVYRALRRVGFQAETAREIALEWID